MDSTAKVVNIILAKAIHHRQFSTFLEEIEHEHSDLLLHNSVRWLSRGKVLKRFAAYLSEICQFLDSKGSSHPELSDNKWQ